MKRKRMLPLDMGAVQAAVIRDHLEVFRASGFDFAFPEEKDKQSSVMITCLPHLHNTQFDESDVDEMVSALALNPGQMYRPTRLRRIFASKACRQAVMIGTRLDKDKMTKIVSNLSTLDHPWCCPHGRPTLRHLFDLSKLNEQEKEKDEQDMQKNSPPVKDS